MDSAEAMSARPRMNMVQRMLDVAAAVKAPSGFGGATAGHKPVNAPLIGHSERSI